MYGALWPFGMPHIVCLDLSGRWLRIQNSRIILSVVYVAGILAAWCAHTECLYLAGRMSEDKRFDVYFGCGVGRGHSGRIKMAHMQCLYLAGRMIEDKRFDEYFGCGVRRRHSGRYKMAHRSAQTIS